jgi:hypothetical protein
MEMSISDVERKALMAAVASCIKQHVDKKMKPLQAKIEALEAAQNGLKAEISNLRRGRGGSDAVQ